MNTALSLWQTVCLSGVVLAALFVPFLFKKAEEELEIFLFVCGIAADPQYGPMIMFGTGGVFVEVMKDVGFALAPLTDADAHDLVRSVKAFKLLEGARGTKPADISRVEETLLRLSQLVTDFPIVQELDINPLMISNTTGEAIAVDGRIKLA